MNDVSEFPRSVVFYLLTHQRIGPYTSNDLMRNQFLQTVDDGLQGNSLRQTEERKS
jgi:hypothetical protein